MIDLKTSPPPTTSQIQTLISSILHRCSPTPKIITFTSPLSYSYTTSPLSSSIPTFDTTDPRGLLILVLSMIESRGLENVRNDIIADCGQFEPLVKGPFHLCGTELINLCVFGRATSNVGAYHPMTGEKVPFTPTPVGLISHSEITTSTPIADHWKSPSHQVYIVHGDDHFTLLFKSTPSPLTPKTVFYTYNALPPNRLLLPIILSGSSLLLPPPTSPPTPPPSYLPPLNSLSSIILSPTKHLHPFKWRLRTYELCLHTPLTLKAASYPPRPSNIPPPTTYPLGPKPTGSWRCVACYETRYETMNFGVNGESDTCGHCGRTKEEGGWTIVKHYKELDESGRRRVDRFESKFLGVLRTRFHDVDVEIGGEVLGETHEGKGPVI
ncbi:hypothetical protein TrVE_jg11329 [Triparma verrucosa]|uniref:Deubiquitinating enzyme MINDY-3/4 conserved domain-containing protein n=1 Tax=Triparma verrucosa TaxID=1606542 RepID=A0A9W7CES4_9STRA|nr:hypothetical protein TrVE_jg11329 [Triparma verrucosa]